VAEPVLEVRDLHVAAGETEILRGVSFLVRRGEVHVLLGPNGSGKTTLLMAVMGMPGFTVTGGSILLAGEEITALPPDERARRGIALSFQRPPEVHGISLRALAERVLARHGGGELAPLAAALEADRLLDREVNVGFSGGELKRAELLQLLAMKPELALFDEPESGVDLDSIAIVGEGMRRLLGRGEGGARERAALIVTHTGHILREVPADRGHVLMRGEVVCEGDPGALFEDIRRHGYEGCLTCERCRPAARAPSQARGGRWPAAG